MTRLAALALGLTACGYDNAASMAAPSGVMRGVVAYDGPVTGALEVAVFSVFPPRGVPMARWRAETPEFPQPYEIDAVPAGRWFVLAMVDVDPTDGDRYHPNRDPGGAYGVYGNPAAITMSQLAGADSVDIDLVEPSAASIWASGGYR
jgi:hypothetical protein